jgi:hypothetical protein
MQKKQEKESRNPRKPANLEGAPSRTAVDPQRFVQRPVERGAVVAKLLPEPLLRLSLDEMGQRGVSVLPLLLQTRSGSSAQRRGPGAVRWAPQRRTNVTPGHERSR